MFGSICVPTRLGGVPMTSAVNRMDGLPIDTSHPLVRQYLALIRLQVLSPLLLLVNATTAIACATIASPSIGDIARLHFTSLTPNKYVFLLFLALLFLGQLALCVLLITARKADTKKTLVNGVGIILVLSNGLMALSALSWVFKLFLFACILQGITLALLLFSNARLLLFHSPTSQRPLDTIFIHAPMRFFLVMQLNLLFPLALFVYLQEQNTKWLDEWPAFGVALGTNLLGCLIIAIRRDIVWCLASTWINVGIWSLRPKPAPVMITAIMFTVINPLTLLISFVHSWYTSRRRVSLPGDEHPGLHRTNTTQNHYENPNGPREVDEDAVWGS